MSVIPMFPLGTVLFPSTGLPLRIFEQRYRELTRVCLDDDHRFGIVLIESGSEVGGVDERFDLGTIAHIVQAEVDPDGQARLMTVGRERFRVERWIDGALYPQAEVTFFEDNDQCDVDAVHNLTKRVRRMLAMRAELNIAGPPATIELHDDPETRLWQLCALIPCGPHDDLAMLATPNSKARVELIGRLLDTIDANTNRLLQGSSGNTTDETDGDPTIGSDDPS